jgi:hypothetical protein
MVRADPNPREGSLIGGKSGFSLLQWLQDVHEEGGTEASYVSLTTLGPERVGKSSLTVGLGINVEGLQHQDPIRTRSTRRVECREWNIDGKEDGIRICAVSRLAERANPAH